MRYIIEADTPVKVWRHSKVQRRTLRQGAAVLSVADGTAILNEAAAILRQFGYAHAADAAIDCTVEFDCGSGDGALRPED